jgi:hypothetical protein
VAAGHAIVLLPLSTAAFCTRPGSAEGSHRCAVRTAPRRASGSGADRVSLRSLQPVPRRLPGTCLPGSGSRVQVSRSSSRSKTAVQKTIGATSSQWPSAASALVNRRNSRASSPNSGRAASGELSCSRASVAPSVQSSRVPPGAPAHGAVRRRRARRSCWRRGAMRLRSGRRGRSWPAIGGPRQRCRRRPWRRSWACGWRSTGR